MKLRNRLLLAALAMLLVMNCEQVAVASEFAVRTFIDICTMQKSNDQAIAELRNRREWRLLKTDKNKRGTVYHYWNSANGSSLRPRTGSTVVVLQTSRNNERCSVGIYNKTLASIQSSLRRVARVGELERNELGYSAFFTIEDPERLFDGELFTRADRWWFLMLDRTRHKQISASLRL